MYIPRLVSCSSVSVLQVGWEWRGLAVWSPSGCRLVCSLRQTAQDAVSTPRVPLSVHSPLIPSGPGSMPLPLESGISAMTWSAAGYSLLLTETASSGQMLELALARSLDAAHRVVQGSRPGPAPSAAGFFTGRPAKQALLVASTALLRLVLSLHQPHFFGSTDHCKSLMLEPNIQPLR